MHVFLPLGRPLTLQSLLMSRAIQFTAAIVMVVISSAVARGRISATTTPTARDQAADAADVAEGMRLYLQKGDCQACHGWAADGRKMDSQMPDGSNLRETRLNRE